MKEIVNDGFAKVVKPYMDAQDKKSREIIAPVEVSPAEAAHSAGDQIIFNGILYDVIAPIAINDALSTSGAGANISAADNIEAQIKATKSQIQTAAAQAAAQNKNTQEMIAPVEEDETDASRAYAIGDQLILDGVLYNVIDAIAQHGIITSEGAGANIEEADNVTDQLSSLNGALSNKADASTLTALQNDFYEYEDLMGVKNVLPDNLSSQSVESVDFTVNADGSITVNGTVTPEEGETAYDIVLPIATGLDFFSSNISLENTGIYTGTDYIFSQGDNGTNGVYLTYVASTGTVNINVEVGTTVDNVTLYPMIRLKDTDNIYKPYTMTNQQMTRMFGNQVEKSQISNPNLLDNPWFNVNQREFTTGGTGGENIVYAVDRWLLYGNSSTLTKNADGTLTLDNSQSVSTTSGLMQRFDNDANVVFENGETYTLSALIRVDAVSSTSSPYNPRIMMSYGINSNSNTGSKGIETSNVDNDFRLISYTFTIDPNASIESVCNARIRMAASEHHTVTIKAMKLEKGNISTLAMDTAPNYATELLKCQRYFHKYATQSLRPSNQYDCVPEMRTTPTQSDIIIDGTTYYVNSADL